MQHFKFVRIVLVFLVIGCAQRNTSGVKSITDISSMSARADGKFDVVCKSGAKDVVTEQQLKTGSVCLPEHALAAGSNHTCVIARGKVKCWGDNRFGQLNVKERANLKPTYIAARDNRTCVITGEFPISVVCWGGENAHGENADPLSIIRPTMVAVGDRHTCADSDGKIQCWGDDSLGRFEIQGATNKKFIAANDDSTCSIDNSGSASCRGGGNIPMRIPSEIKNAEFMAVADHFVCLVGDSRIRCIGDERSDAPRGLERDLPKDSPVRISASKNAACVMFKDDFNCSGLEWRSRPIKFNLIDAKQIANGNNHVCVIDAEGLKCWEMDGKPSKIPSDIIF